MPRKHRPTGLRCCESSAKNGGVTPCGYEAKYLVRYNGKDYGVCGQHIGWYRAVDLSAWNVEGIREVAS